MRKRRKFSRKFCKYKKQNYFREKFLILIKLKIKEEKNKHKKLVKQKLHGFLNDTSS